MRLVVDTNVLVSSLLTPRGTAARLMDHLIGAGDAWLVDLRILAAYRQVLPRPRFRLSSRIVEEVFSAIDASVLIIEAAPLRVRLPDPTDLPFLEVAAAGRADALVTGNARHFVPLEGAHGIRVVSPREALELLAGGGAGTG